MTDNPYLGGGYAPIDQERSLDELEVVEGAIPRDLFGSYVRNGPNPRFDAAGAYHWFDGDGMLHAVHFEDGRARYANRWIRTAGFEAEQTAGASLWSGLMESVADNPKQEPYKDTANTDVVLHRGELLTTWYICGAAYRVDPHSLETLGVARYGREEPMRMSAHTKVDEQTGELCFFDYGVTSPRIRYGVVSAAGELEHLRSIELPGPRLPHDMALTEHHAIVMDLPVFFRPEALHRQKWIVGYHPELPARFGVLPRRGEGEVRWFEAEPCYIYHVINAWEEDGVITMVGFRVVDPTPAPDPRDGVHARMMANLRLTAHLHRWRFDLATGQTHEEQLDDANAEFPCIDNRRMGQRTRYGYPARLADAPTLLFDALIKYDTDTGQRTMHEYGEGIFGSEAAFAPTGAGEDDGYLVTLVDDRPRDRSEAWIYDARAVEQGPVAKVAIPGRVPLGFHACWAPGEALARDQGDNGR